MRKLRPSKALLAYLDLELEGRSAPPLQPPAAAQPHPNRKVIRRAAAAAVAVALTLAGIGIASLALAQDALACTEAEGELDREGPLHPYSCCAPVAPIGEPPAGGSAAAAETDPERADPEPDHTLPIGAAGFLLLLVAVGVVLAPDLVRRERARADLRARASRMSIQSRRGGRRTNEDRSTAFSVGPYDVLVAADGMGGHVGGARAASIVVASVQRYLEHRLPPECDTELVRDLVRSAFARAAEALAAEDAEIGLGARGVDGLRSTLIVAVASPETYVVGAQGDGGAWVQRASGITLPLMTAAKGEAANIVTSSLGPVPEGSVEIAVQSRMARDLLVVCTDGVADRVGPEFDEALRAHADDAEDAREIVRSILGELEQRPLVFDDNITFGLVITP